MSGEAAVEAVQAEHGDQQGAHAQIRRREPIQVRIFIFIFCYVKLVLKSEFFK